MLDLIFNLVSGALNFLSGLLPDSPFEGILDGLQLASTALGWLNWGFPVGECLAAMAAWLAICAAIIAVKITYKKATGVWSAATGGYTDYNR